ncbi:MAG: hypothetical protein GXX78_16690, partial [Bacteroidales bacterium]|nr:hypothetical protein [Bacteroidales bacterium]
MAQTTLNFHPEMFDNLDTSKLSTNILANKAGHPGLISGFDGTSSCDTANVGTWLYAYKTLYAGDINTPTIPLPGTMFNKIASAPADDITIGALYFSYNYIGENAFNNGFIQLVDTLFYDGPNSGNPYNEDVCVSVGVLYSDTLKGSVTFKTEPLRGNLTGNIASAQINFSDGNGYVTYTADTEYNINYYSSGYYVIILKLNLSNGGTVYAKTGINVSTTYPALSGSPFDWVHSDYKCDACCNIVPTSDRIITIERDGYQNDGVVKIWYGNDATGDKKTSLTKPVVLVDGFDPIPTEGQDRSAEEIYFETNFNGSYPASCTEDILNEDRMESISEGLIDRLKDLGYDIAIVDFEWGGNDILENVETLKSVINRINSELSNNGSNEELIVMGPSMGALISRIALSEMNNHNTRLYISFDGPHQGAYIPMPLQKLYGYFSGILDGTVNLAEFLYARLYEPLSVLSQMKFKVALGPNLSEYSPLDCPAAKQMLMYHYLATSNNSPFSPTVDHTSLYNSISGDYPANCMNVAISCGDGHGGSQLNFPTAGTDYLGYSTNTILLNTIIQFKELPETGSMSTFMKFKIWEDYMWGLFDITYINEEYKSYTTSFSKSYEHQPGGDFNSTNLISDMVLSKLDNGFYYDKYECFMPLKTAFDLSSSVSNNIFSEFNMPSGRNFTKNIYPSKSPFDMLYVCDENRYHVLRGPKPATGTATLPGMTENMGDFVVFLVENLDYIEGATQSAVYDLYDIYYNNGIQTCSQAFNVDLLENGIVTKSYNSSAVTISDATLTGNNKS